jgi:hypothetical protein
MAIEASNLTEKDELISKFYTVRAGLSVIAEESAKIHLAESNLEKARYEDECHDENMEWEYMNDCKNYNAKLQELEAEAKSKKECVYEKENILETAINTQKELKSKPVKSYYNGEKEIRTSVLLGVGVFLTIELLGWGCFELLIKLPFFQNLLPAAILLAAIIALAIEILTCRSIKNAVVNKYANKNRTLKIFEAETKVKEAREDLDMAKKSVLEAEQEYNNYLLCKPKREDYSFYEYRDDVIEAENELNAVIATATATAKAAKEALVEYTEGLLVEDDWKNVDLLIFYLKTGRADTLQDALLLVDKQRQTDQITEAIATAAQYVGSSLEKVSVRIDSLSANMTKELNRLDSTIERNNSYLISAVSGTSAILGSQINRFNEEMSRQNQALLKAQDINNALLERANTQSDELMNELRYNQRYWVK